MARSEVCELCGSNEDVTLMELPVSDGSEEQSVYVCATCKGQIESGDLDDNHFNCLNDSMWSETSAVKVLSYILLNKLGRQDMVDMMYLEEEEQKLADQAINAEANKLVYKDCNGVELHAGDSIVIMKDLEVKGAGFTAKRGTTVTRIALAPNDPTHIEGRVNGTKIFLKTEFIKKA
ncbi:alkylphosphonate utilization protein [Sulfurimonas sp. C5]|uniref:PhnA domain-containing protein n=1 Tax=Sulfurimonas sp. C5 TaxID=3036947 RepID=UPI002458A45B|nr:alkylphosphonate utilization protein [Sulfurimonas sp. C5]MDH4944864.1 PhnA domain-containing protein [Sulfurimonas sp. C5]